MSEFVWSEPEPLEDLHLPDWLLTSAQRRRLKALLVLAMVWGVGQPDACGADGPLDHRWFGHVHGDPH
jgi:hypothetical protein